MQALSGQDDEGKDVDNAKADHEDEVVCGTMAAEASAAAQPVLTQAEHTSQIGGAWDQTAFPKSSS